MIISIWESEISETHTCYTTWGEMCAHATRQMPFELRIFTVNFSVNGNDPGCACVRWNQTVQTVCELSGFPLITIFCVYSSQRQISNALIKSNDQLNRISMETVKKWCTYYGSNSGSNWIYRQKNRIRQLLMVLTYGPI